MFLTYAISNIFSLWQNILVKHIMYLNIKSNHKTTCILNTLLKQNHLTRKWSGGGQLGGWGGPGARGGVSKGPPDEDAVVVAKGPPATFMKYKECKLGTIREVSGGLGNCIVIFRTDNHGLWTKLPFKIV